MKILVLAQSAGVGGVESSLTQFVKHVVSLGHEVSVVFWRDSGPVLRALPPEVTVIDIQRGLANQIYRTGGVEDALRRPGALPRLRALGAIGVRRILRLSENPWILLNSIPAAFDVAIAFRHEGYGPYYLVDKVHARKKIMWFHHGAYTASPMGRRVDRRYFGKLDSIVAVSSWVRTVLTKEFPELEERIAVVPNLLDREAIVRSSLESVSDLPNAAGIVLVTVSRLSLEKGIDIAVRTASLLKKQGLDFVWCIIGDGPERASLCELIASLGLEECVFLLGERVNPFPYMRRADIYVQTSRVEAYGLTIEEAKVLGRPIIASNIPSALEVLDDGELGLLCEPEAGSFAEAILRLASDNDAREVLRQRLAVASPTNAAAHQAIDRLLRLDAE